MFARRAVFSKFGRGMAMATVAAVALTAVEPSLARADSGKSGHGLSTATVAGGATDFSARRVVHYRRGAGGAAAAAAFAGIVGTGLAIAATQNRRAYYDDYYGRPAYYGGPGYYGGGPYYGGGGYYGRGWGW
ncbi:MAG TPA: hypothetical protein VFE89_03685 [Beijerinckiaceae bacterium]|jgi:hypothetical protein|nr:hypothetical protein [Beijerinckiaceae bacterium]